MTRLLRAITRLNIGGPARQVLLLTRELADRYPTVLCAGRPGVREGELSDPEVDVTRVPLTRPVRPLTDLRATGALRALMKRHEVELVHTHTAKAGAAGRIAASTLRPRPIAVHTFHGHVLEGYFPPFVQRAFIEAERALARRTDVLVAVSDEVRDDLLDLGIGRPDQYRVVPLGLELDEHLQVDGRSGRLLSHLGLGGDVPLIGALGRFAPIKDHLTLIDAVAHVADAHLVILGDGALRHELEQRIDELDLTERVHLPGWWHDVPAAIADLDVVALSSRNEGTPVSLIEAHACARPAVATDVGGVRAVVLDDETGYLVPPGDPQALAERLQRLVDDPGRRHRFGRAGREHVRSRFDAQRLVEDVVRLYDELTGEG